MNKQEFLDLLRNSLSGLPKDEVEERLAFYSEIIDDRIEEGLSEEEAVSAVGSVKEISKQIISEIPLTKIAKGRIKPKRRLNVAEIILLVLGSPIWLSLLIAALAVILSLYVVLWSAIISLWAIFVSLTACSVSSIPACVILDLGGNIASGLAILAAGIVLSGLSIFMFYGCKAATKGILILTKKIAIFVKNCFIRKEEAL